MPKLDHSEFVNRHLNKNIDHDYAFMKPQKPNFVTAFIILTLYVCICIGIAVMLNINHHTLIMAAFVFLATAVLAFYITKYVDGFQRLSRERDLFFEVLEGSRGARIITDSADNTVFYNIKFQKLIGEEKPKDCLASLKALFEGNEYAANSFQDLIEKAQRGLTETKELCLVKNTREQWLHITTQPVASWAGYIHWRIDDITQEREADKTIREEREKLIDFTDNAPVGFFSADEEGRFVFVNATLARWLGEDIQSLLNQGRLHNYLVKPPEEGKPYDILKGNQLKQIGEITMKGPAGRSFEASVNQIVVAETGGIVRTRAVVHDLTAEREMRRALQASEDKFERFFEEAPLGIAFMAPNGTINDCNTALSFMLKKKTEEIEGQNFFDLVPKEDQEGLKQAIKIIEGGEDVQKPMELALKPDPDTDLIVQMHARKFKGGDSIVLQFIDITEQKVLEEQFSQSQKMQAVGQLAGGIAHDFNNLLTAIIGFCDLLLLRHKAGDPSFGDIMQIKQNSNRASNLVRQLLAFSRQQTLRPKVQDIGDIITEVSHLIRRLIGANIELEVQHGEDLDYVKVDISQMEQVFVNLAVNARDAMESGGKLTIKTSNYTNRKKMKRGDDEMPTGHWVLIEVRDTGHGIPEDVMKRIFEPFFTTKEVGQGTGLGLATVYGIIRQTGGYLHVESEVDKGTVFSVYLPRLKEMEEEEQAADDNGQQAPKDLTGTARILLVEDEDAVRTFSTRALTNKGYEVLGASNGENAIELLEKEDLKSIDLLITDVVMPDMDGPTLAKHVRQDSKDLKIIFISGYTEDRLKDHMGKNIYFLPKPFTLKQLAEKVKDVLDD